MMPLRTYKWIILVAAMIGAATAKEFAGDLEYENLDEKSFSNSDALNNIMAAMAEEAALFETMQKNHQQGAGEKMDRHELPILPPEVEEEYEEEPYYEDNQGRKLEGDEGEAEDGTEAVAGGKPTAPFETTFVLRLNPSEPYFKASGLDGKTSFKTKLKLVECLNEASRSKCGEDSCVSFSPIGEEYSGKYLRRVGEQVQVLRHEAGSVTSEKESSFCLRPGVGNAFSVSLEPVTETGSFVEQDEDSRFLYIKSKDDVADDDASFIMMGASNACHAGKDCVAGFFCHKGTCYPKRDTDQMCEQHYHCKSGNCRLDRIGNLYDGFFIRICDDEAKQSN